MINRTTRTPQYKKTFQGRILLKLFTMNEYIKPILCDICGKLCSTDIIKTVVQNDGKQYICNTCFGAFDNLKKGLISANPQGTFTCTICSKTITSRHSLKNHLRRHAGENPKDVKKIKYHMCCICSMTFSYLGHFLRHFENQHSEEGPHTCKKCKETFPTEMQLEKHSTIHSVIKKSHACNECAAAFCSVKALKRHSVKHSGKNVHNCTECDKAFHTERSLICHNRIHKLKQYQCGICKRDFKYKGRLKRHQLVHTGVTCEIEDSCNTGI